MVKITVPNINRELAQTHVEFKDFYNKNLRTIYEELEPVRKKYLRSFCRRFFFYAVGILFFVFLCVTGVIDKELLTSKGFMKFTFVIYGGWFVYVFMPFSDYRSDTKDRVMEIILSFWEKAQYKSLISFINRNNIVSSELFPEYNKEDTDDSFTATHNNIKISVAEQVIKISGNRNETNIFKGALILLEFNKKFKGKTVVKSKFRFLDTIWNNPLIILTLCIPFGFAAFLVFRCDYQMALIFSMIMLGGYTIAFGIIYLFNFRKKTKKATKCVLLEGLNFMKRWNVYTDDQIGARIVLTPVLMENMLKVRKLFHGRHIDFSFFNNKLLIAVHTRKNLFETTSLFTPALNYGKVREVVNQLYSIFSVIDVLNIKDTKTAKMPAKSKKLEEFSEQSDS